MKACKYHSRKGNKKAKENKKRKQKPSRICESSKMLIWWQCLLHITGIAGLGGYNHQILGILQYAALFLDLMPQIFGALHYVPIFLEIMPHKILGVL